MASIKRSHPSTPSHRDSWVKPADDPEAPAPTHTSTEPWHANTLVVIGAAIVLMIILGLLVY